LEHWNRRRNSQENDQTQSSPKKGNGGLNPAEHLDWIPRRAGGFAARNWDKHWNYLFDLIAIILETVTDPFFSVTVRIRIGRILGICLHSAGKGVLFKEFPIKETIFRAPTAFACWVVVSTNFA